MKTQEGFIAELKALLKKYNAEISAEDHYQGYPECGEDIYMTVSWMSEYDKDGNKLRPNHSKYGDFRIRKMFCFIPVCDSHEVWHWLEQIAVLEQCNYEIRENWYWGESWACGWKRIDSFDVKFISDVQKIIDKKDVNQLSESYQIHKLKSI
jgi:hypothetical protein